MSKQTQEPSPPTPEGPGVPAFTEVVAGIVREPLQDAVDAQRSNSESLKKDLYRELERVERELRGRPRTAGAQPPSLATLTSELLTQQQLTATLQADLQSIAEGLRSMTNELQSAIAEVARVGEATAREGERSARRQWAITIALLVILVLAGIFIDPYVGS